VPADEMGLDAQQETTVVYGDVSFPMNIFGRNNPATTIAVCTLPPLTNVYPVGQIMPSGLRVANSEGESPFSKLDFKKVEFSQSLTRKNER
jgi:hypothetical protein